MSQRVLIAYGSKHGSTAETAERIGEMLRERGLEADISEAARITTLDRYDAVIVAGSLYTGRWHSDSRRFIQLFASKLSELPVAIFAMGPGTSEPDDIASARRQLDGALKRLPDVGADPVAIFGGVIDPAQLHFPFNRLPATDGRDWAAIEGFADQFAARVYRGDSQPAGIG
jgi:menaquinone-dependent protoporphyrinogen oxidase